MIIFFFFLVFQAYSRLIVNTQTDLQSMHRIPNGDQVLTIWLRPQVQFLQFYDITPPCIFTILSGVLGQNITLFKYSPLDDRDIVIFIENQQEEFQIQEEVKSFNQYYSWMNIVIYIQQNHLTRLLIKEKSIDIIQSTYEIQYLYAWQNTTYTCQIYDQYQKQQDDIILLIIQSNYIFKQYFQYIQNYRTQIQIKIYGQFLVTDQTLELIRIQDQLGYLEICQNKSHIIIKFLCYLKGKEMQELEFLQSDKLQNYWYSVEFVFEAYALLYQIQYMDKIYDGILYSTFDFMTEKNNENLVFSLSISISSDFLHYKLYIINKSSENSNFSTENLCYKNCKFCQKLKCLECEGNLTTETYCQCLENQEFDKNQGTCVDKTSYFQINQLDAIPSCQLGYYLNLITNKCQQCPKLNEYTCTECVFQTKKWNVQSVCRFQEISQKQFVEQNAFQLISMNKIEKLYDIEHKVKLGDNLSNAEYTNQIFVEIKDPYQIFFEKCEKNYYYNFDIQKCFKKNKGNFQQFYYINQIAAICNVGSIQVNNKCQKCQKNCLNCQYLSKHKKIICILPATQYDIDDKNRLYQCKDNCQLINKQQLDNIKELAEYCLIDNCQICIEGSCLLCKENYVADTDNFCMKGHYYSESYNLDMGNNNQKPQFNQIQMLYLTQQIIQLGLDIDYQNTIQIILFANNFTSIRPKIKQIQASTVYSACENQTSYMDSVICEATKPNYQYLYNNIVAYCPENKCHHDLIINMDIILSNKHTILYEDKSFTSFQQFFGNIDIHDISISNIVINANVYAYDSPQQICITNQMFLYRRQNSIQYFLNLNFLGLVAFFPDCLIFQEINFDTILIENLQTDSSLQLKIDCFNFTMKNSSFLGQKSPLFDINAKIIVFDSIRIENFQQHENVSTFQFSSSDEIIIELILSKITISNVKVKYVSLVQIYDFVDNGLFININISNTQFQKQSVFLTTITSSNLNFQSIYIKQSNFSQSNFICIEEDLFYFLNKLYISDIYLFNVRIIDYSIFILSFDHLEIQNFQVISSNISNSLLISSYKNVLMNNIIFQDLQILQSQIMLSKGSQIQISNLLLMDSKILYSLRLLDLKNEQSFIDSFTISNSSYYPNFQPITINNMKGMIYLSNIMINNISIDMNAVYYDFIQINNNFSILTLSSEDIKINNILINTIQINIQSLLSIYSQKLIFNYFYLHNCDVQIYQKYLINIEQKNQLSNHMLNKIIFDKINIKSTKRILQVNEKKQFFLIQFKGLESKNYLVNILIREVSSQIETYIFYVQSQILIINRIKILNIDLVGLINQNHTQSYIQQFIYNQSNILIQDQTQSFALFNFDTIFKEQLFLKNCKIYNLTSPLINVFNKNQFLIQIERIFINQIVSSDNLINVQTLLNTIDLSQIFISQIHIIDKYRKISQQVLITGANLKVCLNNIKFMNSQIGITNLSNCKNCMIDKFFILNGSMKKPLIQILNYIGTFSIQYGLVQSLDIEQHSLILVTSNESNYMINYLNIINLQIGLLRGGYLIQFKQEYEEQNYFKTAIFLQNLKLQKSLFFNSIFNFTSHELFEITMKSLSFQNCTCEQLMLSSLRQIRIQNSLVINLQVVQTYNKQKVLIKQSELLQTNLIFVDNVIKDNQTTQFYNNHFVTSQNQHPIQIKFSSGYYFSLILINSNTSQIQFTKNDELIYLPSGQTLKEFEFYDMKTLQHYTVYQSFIINLNYQMQSQKDSEIQCLLTQYLDGDKIGQFSNYQDFKLQNGQNLLEDFMFIFNPYTKYKYIKNNLNCYNNISNHTIIFNVRILPCQIGEYLYQNKCLICDVNKNLYSVTFKSQYCSIIDIHKMSNIKIGQIQLKANFWRPSYSGNMIEYCQIQDVCYGGWLHGDQTCHQSRVGALCKECDIYNVKGQGQYAQNNQDCLLCDPNYSIILKGLAIFIWLCIITYINYNSNQQLTQRYLQFKLIHHKYSDILMRQSVDQVSIILKLFTNYIFVLYLIKDNLNFINNDLLNTIDFISNPSLVVTSQIDCLLVRFYYLDIQYIQLIFRLVVPLLLLSIFYIAYLLFVLLKLAKFKFNSIIIITYCIYLFNQQLIFEIQIKLLSYIQISGIKWQYLNQQFQYFTQKHLELITYFIAPSTAIIFLIPFLLFLTLNGRDKRLFSNIKKFGHIYCDYRQKVYYWEILRIYSKYLNIFFIIQKDSIKQSSIVMFMVINQYTTTKLKPYGLKNLNKFEQTQYSIQIFCLIAIFYLSDSLPIITIIILILFNLIFIIQVINNTLINIRRKYSQQIREIKQKIISKVPRLFKLIKIKETTSTQQLSRLRLSVINLQKKSKSIKNQVIQINPSIIQSQLQSPQFEVEMMIINKIK